MANKNMASAYAGLLFAALLWGFMGIFSRSLAHAGIRPMECAFLRTAVSALAMAVVLLVVDRTAFKVKKRDLVLLVVAGLFKLLSDAFLFASQVKIHLSVSTVLQMTSPYWVLIMAVILFHEKITVRKLVATCIAFVGCIFVSGMLNKGIGGEPLGMAFALLSGISYAAYAVSNKVLLDRGMSTNTAMLYIFILSSVIALPMIDPVHMVNHISSIRVVLDILGVGILLTLIPYWLLMNGMKYLSAFKADLITVTEVVFAIIVGYVFYGEHIGPLGLLGMFLIPFSVMLLSSKVSDVRIANNTNKRGSQQPTDPPEKDG